LAWRCREMKLLWRKAILSLEAEVDPIQNPTLLPSEWASQKRKQRSDDDMRSACEGQRKDLKGGKIVQYSMTDLTRQNLWMSYSWL